MTKRIRILPATWTNVSELVDEVSARVVLTADTDIQIGRSVVAPASGVAVPADVGAEVQIPTGSTLDVWVLSATGCILEIEQAGSSFLIVDGTGTTQVD